MTSEKKQQKKKVLVVDDERAILKVLSIKLRISGYDVVTADCGEEALALASAAHPDIMLLDVIMPGVDGFGVLENLRSFSNLPVIVFSARLENGQKAMDLGANAFLNKPLDIDLMIKKIESLLRQ